MKKYILISLLTSTIAFMNFKEVIHYEQVFGLKQLHFLNTANAEGSGEHWCYDVEPGNIYLLFDCSDCVQKNAGPTLSYLRLCN